MRFITNEASTLYPFFNFIIEPALGPPPRSGWDYLLFAEVERSWLGLGPGQPGDIDVLIVPTWKQKPVVEKACAIEVKRLALRGPNWAKNVDRYGITQAHGLIRCGFPFVGILHVIVTAPGPSENWRTLLKARVIEGDRLEMLGEELVDMTGPDAADRQLARLLSQRTDPRIGLNAIAIKQTFDADDSYFSHTLGSGCRAAVKNNPHPMLLRNIEKFCEINENWVTTRAADLKRLDVL